MKKSKEKHIHECNLQHDYFYKYPLNQKFITNKKIQIICPLHGVFYQFLSHHKSGAICPTCNPNIKDKSYQDYINEAKVKHDNFYHYPKYQDIKTCKDKIMIKCPKHGWFKQRLSSHINGYGCPKCGIEKLSKSRKKRDYYINLANKIHNNKYDYSLIKKGIKANEYVKIKCPKHGIFKQRLSSHLEGNGCKLCSNNYLMSFDEHINECKLIHNGKYNYPKYNYPNLRATSKIKIICPKHGEFEQVLSDHKRGNGCPLCKSSKGEMRIIKILKEMKIKYIHQMKFKDCIFKKQLIFDFYIPDQQILIEYNGEQHYNNNSFGNINNNNKFRLSQLRDNIKKDYANKNGIKLVIIPYWDYDNIEKILLTKI
jgi:hypothetical protein